MTAIAAFVDKDKTWIASDSILSAASTKQPYGSKLLKRGNYIIGFAGMPRLIDAIIETTKLPKQIKGRAAIQQIRDFLDVKLTNMEIDKSEIDLLIITHKRIWEISNLQIISYKKYAAVGSGLDYALGSLHTSKCLKSTGKKAVSMAVKAAIEHCTTCGGRIYIKSI